MILEDKGVSCGYIDLVKDMYDGIVTKVRTIEGETSDFLEE